MFALGLGMAASTHAALTGQWDFSSDLSATVGNSLEYRGDTANSTVFTTSLIGGESAQVMKFPITTPAQGYIMAHGAAPNGGGLFVNQYTMVMDIMFPASSTRVWRSLWQTSVANANDGDLFVGVNNGIGIIGQYHGNLQSDTWYRVAFAFDLNVNNLTTYIDGQLINSHILNSGTDGRWSLDSTALLFTDDDDETASGFINSMQFYNSTLSAEEISALGGATAAGLPVTEPSSVAITFLGALVFLARKGFRRLGIS